MNHYIKINSTHLLIGIGIILIIASIYFSMRSSEDTPLEFTKSTENRDCNIVKETVTVEGSGNDLYPVGTKLEVEKNYYNCQVGNRDEVAMIKVPGRDNYIFKYIKILPGDRFRFEKNKDLFNLIVNGDVLLNSKEEPYAFTEQKISLMKLYADNYKEGIKDEAYFVFGDNIRGGFDSTRFGALSIDKIHGRVVRVIEQPKSE